MKQRRLLGGLTDRSVVTGLWLMLLALCIRLAVSWPARELPLLRVRRALSIAGQCLTVPSVRAETASEHVRKPEKPPKKAVPAREPALPEDPAPPEPVQFSDQEAEEIVIDGSEGFEVEKTSLLLTPLDMQTAAEPLVLIVHTHTTEAYTPAPGWEYEPSEEYRTRDQARSVVRVGEELAAELRRLGVGVIHDRTVCDDPDYDGAYDRSYDEIAAQLEAHPSLQIVLDLHRDAIPGGIDCVTELDGEECARLMLVVGTDGGGLYHPNWQENLSFALKLQALLNRSSPGLCRDISLRSARFNQQFTPCSVLVEMGTTDNTLAQTLPTARRLAAAIRELIDLSEEGAKSPQE